MAETMIYAIDDIVCLPGKARAFLDAYMERYAPGARARGMVLDRVLVSPPMWLDDQPNRLTISWTVKGVGAWWQMSVQGRYDPAVAAWWDEAAAMIESRSRTYAAALDDVEALSHV